MFPTDVYILSVETVYPPFVFLARTPHGGCILRWESIEEQLVDPCSGSRFTKEGEYISGPSRRHLDRLRSTVDDGMIWVHNEIIYGEVYEN